jgi:hypothetical protein
MTDTAMNISRQVAVFRIFRYRVERAMPKRAAISATGISAVLGRARMVLISLAESVAGRPPLRPQARAALRPATVLSRIRLPSRCWRRIGASFGRSARQGRSMELRFQCVCRFGAFQTPRHKDVQYETASR